MRQLLDFVKNLLTYKEPKNTEQFELLEDASEKQGQENRNKPEVSGNSENEKKVSCKKRIRKLGRGQGKEEKQAESQKQTKSDTILPGLQHNIERMKREFNIPNNKGIILREFKVSRRIDSFIIYIDGMVDNNTLNNLVLRQLMSTENFADLGEDCALDYIKDNVLAVNSISEEREYEKIVEGVLNGAAALFMEECDRCLIIYSPGYEKRPVEQAVTEKVIKGSQEGFTEDLSTNISLIRRIIKNKSLTTEIMKLGDTNKTNCAVLYLEGIANPEIIKEVRRRINSIDTDFISSNGMFEEFISDKPLIPFPKIVTTERPDRSAASLMDGRVIVIINGSPFVSSIPGSFFEAIQSPEDFGLRWENATFLRYLRMLALFLTLLLPGLYTAVTLFHQEMIPTELLSSIVKTRENVPFPTILEVLLLEISFELIREGGLRVPGAIGNTLGIVGALILGQAAAQAQLVSPILIIVVAVGGISSFAIPSYSMAFTLRLLRLVFIFAGAFAGFYGISVALVIVVGLACSIKSYGVPYFVPIAPKTKANPDVITSFLATKQKIKPDFLNPLNKNKSGKDKNRTGKERGGNGK